MHTLITLSLGFAALLWIFQSLRAAIGSRRIPRLSQFPPLPDSECPRISIVFAARNEAPNLPAAITSMLAIDYPDLEVIAVNDRSDDGSGEVLDEFARNNSRLKVIHVAELPPGWLGKPHALQVGSLASTGVWIVFTDADVRFSPDVLRRALNIAITQRVDHLSLFAKLELFGFWEHVIITYFTLGFLLGIEPWQTSNPRSTRYVGIGAFQMIRRNAYNQLDHHTKLAMEVVEDMKLAKLVKMAGLRSQVAFVKDELIVRWHAGLGNIIRGTTKNFFAATGFNLALAVIHISGILLMSVLPWAALFTTGGLARISAAVCVFCALAMHFGVTRETQASPLYALTHPIGALIYIWMLLRSAIVTLRQGGIIWRDTFYPLSALKKGVV